MGELPAPERRPRAARNPGGQDAGTHLRARTIALLCAILIITALSAPRIAAAAAPDSAFTNTFASLSSSGWVGGDATNSVALPDGRDCWIFSDTITSASTAGLTFAHNSIVITGRGRPQVIDNPMPPPSPDAYYWAGAAQVHGPQVWEIAEKIVQTGPGLWDFHLAGDYLAKINISDWRLASITPLPGTADSPINWGVAILDHGPYTYIYGSESDGLASWMHVARVPKGRLDTPWSYYTASGWTPQPHRLAAAAPRRRPCILSRRPRLPPRDQSDHPTAADGTSHLLMARRHPRRPIHRPPNDLQHRQLRPPHIHLQHTRAPRTDHRRTNALLIQRQQLRPAHTRRRQPLPPAILPRAALSPLSTTGNTDRSPTTNPPHHVASTKRPPPPTRFRRMKRIRRIQTTPRPQRAVG